MTKKCKDVINEKWEGRKKDLEELLKYDAKGKAHPKLGWFNEYGLSLNFVKPGTFEDQREGYLRYQLSWGGPSDEIRFYQNGNIEYWFLDWFDGASIDITNEPIAKKLLNIFSYKLKEAR